MDVIILLGRLYNGRSTQHIHLLMNREWCQHLYGWLKLMLYHTPFKTVSKYVPVFFPPCSSIFWVLFGQYGCDPIAWLLVQWCINLTHVHTDGLKGVSTLVWMVGAHGTSHIIQGRGLKCPSFHPCTHVTSFECCVASVNMIPLPGCLFNGRSTSHIHPLMN